MLDSDTESSSNEEDDVPLANLLQQLPEQADEVKDDIEDEKDEDDVPLENIRQRLRQRRAGESSPITLNINEEANEDEVEDKDEDDDGNEDDDDDGNEEGTSDSDTEYDADEMKSDIMRIIGQRIRGVKTINDLSKYKNKTKHVHGMESIIQKIAVNLEELNGLTGFIAKTDKDWYLWDSSLDFMAAIMAMKCLKSRKVSIIKTNFGLG